MERRIVGNSNLIEELRQMILRGCMSNGLGPHKFEESYVKNQKMCVFCSRLFEKVSNLKIYIRIRFYNEEETLHPNFPKGYVIKKNSLSETVDGRRTRVELLPPKFSEKPILELDCHDCFDHSTGNKEIFDAIVPRLLHFFILDKESPNYNEILFNSSISVLFLSIGSTSFRCPLFYRTKYSLQDDPKGVMELFLGDIEKHISTRWNVKKFQFVLTFSIAEITKDCFYDLLCNNHTENRNISNTIFIKLFDNQSEGGIEEEEYKEEMMKKKTKKFRNYIKMAMKRRNFQSSVVLFTFYLRKYEIETKRMESVGKFFFAEAESSEKEIFKTGHVFSWLTKSNVISKEDTLVNIIGTISPNICEHAVSSRVLKLVKMSEDMKSTWLKKK